MFTLDLPASDLPAAIIYTFAFMFGASWGSFFNVAIYRWPRGLSVVHPPSHCPGCAVPVAAKYNVPIFGYLFLRGKTGCCGMPLSARYPLVELLTALLAVAVARIDIINAAPEIDFGLAALRWAFDFIFVGGLIIATFVDLERMEIPDEVSLPGAALGLATVALRDPGNAADYALGAGAGFLFIQLVFVWGYERLTGRRGMGEGDSKLLLMIGAFVGWKGALFALVAGSIQGVVIAIYGLVTDTPLGPDLDALEAQERAEAEARGEPWPYDDEPADSENEEEQDGSPSRFGQIKLPFGPFLALGALEYLFFGPRLVEWWFNLMLGE